MSYSTFNVNGAGPIALYVHIPFCETKCPYCDFNTYARIEPLIPAYVAALCREIGIWGTLLGQPPLASVFFGGGTPSYLAAEQIGSVMQSIGEAFDVSADAEVTLEANPGDLTDAKLTAFLGFGLNRLSIGVQSLDDRLLSVLGRRHSASEAVQAVRMATEAGFDNVSIDLMYGLPYQSLDDWAQTLSAAAELGQKHVSMYCLTLEGGTPMEQWVASGRMPEPDPDLAADMYLTGENDMQTRDYRHYEISNWAQPGSESRHNLTYWRNQPYLGVGPGAHSYLSGHRFYNIKSPKEYIRRLEDGAPSLTLPRKGGEDISLPPRWGKARAGPELAEGMGVNGPDVPAIEGVPVVERAEAIDRRLEMAETMMLGLRLDVGIGVEDFTQRFGVAPSAVYGDTLDEMESAGLLDTSGGAVRLTAKGRLLGNEVFSRFFDYAEATA